MKLMISVGLLIGSTLGSWIGSLVSQGNWFSPASIILSSIGAFGGIWGGYVVYRDYI